MDYSHNKNHDIENPLVGSADLQNTVASMESLIEEMKKNQSVITQVAWMWNRVSLWYRIGGGLVIFGGLLLLGAMVQSALFISATIFSALLCSMASLVLDNHHKYSMMNQDHFTASLQLLFNTYAMTINELRKTCNKLSSEVEQFKTNNQELHEENQKLDGIASQYKMMLEELRQMNIELHSDADKFASQIDNLRKHNQQIGRMLEIFSVNFTRDETSRAQFSDLMMQHIDDVNAGKKDFSSLVNDLAKVDNRLNKTADRLEKSVERDEKVREELVEGARNFFKWFAQSGDGKDSHRAGQEKLPSDHSFTPEM